MATTEVDGGGVLDTERLTLRPVAGEDLPDIVALAGDAEVAQWTVSIRHPLSEPEVAAWLASCAAAGEHAFAILPKGESKLIGVVGITVMAAGDASGHRGEIGYWIGRPYWGNGFATEAVRRVLLHGFGALGLAEVEATVFPGNDRSVQVLNKTGFIETGSAERATPARGGDREVIVYTLTRAAFARSAPSQAVGRQ
jgi:RimJ/RimL family protein N-acetyltransferase